MKYSILADLHINTRNKYANTDIMFTFLAVRLITLGHDVIILGDIYESSHPNIGEQVIFHSFIRRLTDANLRVYIILGNHDWCPDGVNVLSPIEEIVGGSGNVIIVDNTYDIGDKIRLVSFNPNLEYLDIDDIPDMILMSHVRLNEFLKKGHGHFGISDLPGARYYVLGDIHTYSNRGDILYPGSVDYTRASEIFEDKYFVVFDINTLEHECISTPTRPVVVNPYSQYDVSPGSIVVLSNPIDSDVFDDCIVYIKPYDNKQEDTDAECSYLDTGDDDVDIFIDYVNAFDFQYRDDTIKTGVDIIRSASVD